jgi:diguanylate cyclase (GGDEF)-like protein
MRSDVGARATPLWRVRAAAAAFSLLGGSACLTQMDHTLPSVRFAVPYLAVAFLMLEAVELFVRGRVRWWSAIATGPLVGVASLGLADKPATIALALSVLASRSLYGPTRMAVVRTALVAVAVPVLVLTEPFIDGTSQPLTAVVVPVVVLVLFSLLLRLLYLALHLQKLVAEREALLASTSRALLEAADVAQAEAVVRSTILRLAQITERLRVTIVPVAPHAARDPHAADDRHDRAKTPDLVLEATAEGLVLTGSASEHPEIRAVVETISTQLALVRANHLAHSELYTMAHHDLLTSLCNRRAFFAGLTSAMHAGMPERPPGVMLIDLDDFKVVNDTHGHAAGDAVLVEAARRMRDVAGEHATVARFGGDEFAVIVPLHAQDDLQHLAEQIRDSIMHPIAWGQDVVRIGVSIGIAHPDPGQTVGDLMRVADLAMYQAKALGKNQIAWYRPTPSPAAPHRELRQVPG